MISEQRFHEYDWQLKALSAFAGKDIEEQILRLIANNPDASVADIRNMTIQLLTGSNQLYSETSSTLAASFYDQTAAEAGMHLLDANIFPHIEPDSLEKTVRYKAKKLVDGDTDGFAHECARYVQGNLRRSANETMMKNVARDGKKKVRFARVPVGAETCPFCFMLASRGAVYYSKETAGAFNHFHNDCDCKIVPAFGDFPDYEIVEGYDPASMRDVMAEIEKETHCRFNKFADDPVLREALAEYYEKHPRDKK